MRGALLLLAAVFFGPAASACLSPDMETSSFLEVLPKSAMGQPFVALVAIKSKAVQTSGQRKILQTDVAVVRVLKNNRNDGERENDALSTIVLQTDETSCSRDHLANIGDRRFIAGVLDEATGRFQGTWRNGSILVPK